MKFYTCSLVYWVLLYHIPMLFIFLNSLGRRYFLFIIYLGLICPVAEVCKPIYEPRHEISNNVVCATSKASDQPAHTRSLIRAFACHLNILWLLSYWPIIIGVYKLKGGCTASSESTLFKMPHCWKSHVTAHVFVLEKWKIQR